MLNVENKDGFISHPYIKDKSLEYREYQAELIENSSEKSSLVTIPTGTGKTAIAVVLSAERLYSGTGPVLMLAPTKPLVEQHVEFYQEMLDIPDSHIQMFTGETRPAKRGELWTDEEMVYVATPQVIENDILSNNIDISTVSHLIFDECHRATGDYSYVYIAEKYDKTSENPFTTALSASPGSTEEEILTICENTRVKNIEIITDDDQRLQKYLYDTDINDTWIDLHDEIYQVQDILQGLLTDILNQLKDAGYSSTASQSISRSQLFKIRDNIDNAINNSDTTGGMNPYNAKSLYSEADKVHRLLERLELFGVEPFLNYVEALEQKESKTKAVKRLLERKDFIEAVTTAEKYSKTHPKLQEIRMSLIDADMNDGKVLIFTDSRDNVEKIVEFINSHDKLNAHRFVGQSDSGGNEGMTQTEQKDILDRFANNEFTALVATSIAEEGLDIPHVDSVILSEPVSSSIQKVQRMGRTGRQSTGEVKILISKGTREIGYYKSSQNDVEQMKQDMTSLKGIDKNELESELSGKQETLSSYAEKQTTTSDTNPEVNPDEIDTVSVQQTEEGVTIALDHRELSSNVAREIDRDGHTTIQKETLDVGDYVVSEDVAVERKTVDDFLDSLVGDRDMFEQLANLSNNYNTPILLLEGPQEEIYTRRNIHENAIDGVFRTISTMGISLLLARNEEHTATHLIELAKSEQENQDKSISLHEDKRTQSTEEKQEYIVASLTNIEQTKAKRLLKKFGTVENVFTADKEQLTEVEGIADKTASELREIVSTEY